MKFIDLFAGLGGFHLALKELGHECVFASEIKTTLRTLYEENFSLKPYGDIRKIRCEEIPAHDILCAGFPCKPFSKAGYQNGFKCKTSGNLFDEIIRILTYHKPNYIILENVANLLKHDKERTWKIIQEKLAKAGYKIDSKILSPHEFGIPQVRKRIFIVGGRRGLEHFEWPDTCSDETPSFKEILDSNPQDAKPLPERIINYLNIWQEFLDLVGDNKFPLPLWSMEFGADYPYEETTPFGMGLENLHPYKGSHGIFLQGLSNKEIAEALPSYAYKHPKAKVLCFPKWKINHIRKNRLFYEEHASLLNEWLPKVKEFEPSYQKFEWNCDGEERNLWNFVIQLRASGIRVKRRSTASSLVGVTTQVPIIAWESRYVTPREGAKLQCMEALQLPETPAQTFTALGNAVNVKLVELIAKALIP